MAGLSLCIIFFAFSFSARNAQGEPFQAPSYNINLDLPPEERWVNVTSKYAKYSPLIVDAIRQEIPTYLVPLAELLALYMEKHFPEPFPAEMRGVSKGLNLTLTDTLLLNIMYDLTAFCTSVVAQDNQGSIFHGRNLDYRFTGILRNITFISNFQSKGKLMYTGVTFAGQVGLLTAQRPNTFTISLDERDQGFVWQNILLALLNKKAIPVTFLVRNVVSTPGTDFDHALEVLSQMPLIADCYLILGGVNAGQGAVITRDREDTANIWLLSNDTRKNPWFLVETNYDHWTTPPPSDDRRHPAIKALTKITQEKIDAETLFSVMSEHPVLNNKTVYTSIMQAKNPDLFNTWIRRP